MSKAKELEKIYDEDDDDRLDRAIDGMIVILDDVLELTKG